MINQEFIDFERGVWTESPRRNVNVSSHQSEGKELEWKRLDRNGLD